jgi:hypothetical protein
MRRRGTRRSRDAVAFVLVLIGHALLVFIFARVREHERIANESTNRSTLILVDVPAGPPRAIAPTPVRPAQMTIEVPMPPPLSRIEDVEPAVQPSTPSIDWRGEAAQSARNAIQDRKVSPRGFEEKAPAVRVPKVRPFKWDPSPGRFGFAGGLPYMELGKRCAIGLGFFGCAIGELPPPDWHLFDEMNNPHRDRGSVPAPSE